MEKYTVIGFYEDNGQIFSHHTEAGSSSQAFYNVARLYPEATFVTAIKGHLREGFNDIAFPGDSLVDGETVLEQEDVFNVSQGDTPCTSSVIADFNIQDWHLIEVGDHWTGPKEHRDTYRFVIEQSPRTKQIYFRVYPAALDNLSSELEQNGLAGCIEIRNGKPAISIGTNENALPVHIESDVIEGIYINFEDESAPVRKRFESFDHGMAFDSYYYRCNESGWLMETRAEIANKHFERFDYGDMVVIDDSGWEIDDAHWSKVVFFENPTGGDSIKGHYELQFGKESIVVISESGN